MLLGLEPNGRVGSLMPDHPVLDETEKWVASVEDREKETIRVTLTLPVINSSSNIAMVVAGSASSDAVYSAFKHDNQQDSRKLPAKLISPEEGELVWYMDKAAASKLFKEEVHIDKRSQLVS
ncbi:probable 6-phosphogluconolactonase 3, chloroplastic [Neltuma alba]|nr:probable 6-phosphogluconolactonase 3, chloroplastic [Prosopis alba]